MASEESVDQDPKPAELPGEDTKDVQDTGAEQENSAAPGAEGEKTEERAATPPIEPWVERRLGQLTAEKHEQRRAREAAEAEVVTLRERVAKLFKPDQGGEQPANPAPKPEATAPLSAAEIDALVNKRAGEIESAKSFNKACDDVHERGTKEFGDDFESARKVLVSAYGEDIQSKPEFLQAIVANPDGHKVFYELGRNPQEAERILALAPVPMAVEISRLAASLSKPTGREVSSAPAPIRGIDGSARKQASLDDDDLPIDEWIALREKDLLKRGRA